MQNIEVRVMKCKKGCTEVVHFVSEEMSAVFNYAVVNMPDGTEKYMSISNPTKIMVRGHGFDKTPIFLTKPYLIKVFDGIKDGIKQYHVEIKMPEIVYGAKYTGIAKSDNYYKDIKKIERFAKQLTVGE